MPHAPSPLLWDVLEEHLDEAAFAGGQLERSFTSPLHRIEDVEQGEEERLLANIDGLVLGGTAVATRLLLPALEEENAELTFAAALALLTLDASTYWGAVVAGLEEAPEPMRVARSRALELAPFALDPVRLAPLLTAKGGPLLLTGLEVAIGRRMTVASSVLDTALRAGSVQLKTRAIVAAAQGGAVEARELEAAVPDEDPAVQAALATALLTLDPKRGLARCRALLGSKVPSAWRAGALGLALCSDQPEDLERILGFDPPLGREALWALGFSGRAVAADRCLEVALASKPLRRVGCEAFAAISGADREAPRLFTTGPASEEEDPLAPDAQLLEGDVEGLVAWWKRNRERFRVEQRCLRGLPLDGPRLRDALLTEPMRRRPALALQIQVRLAQRVPVRTRALSQVQRADVAALPQK